MGVGPLAHRARKRAGTRNGDVMSGKKKCHLTIDYKRLGTVSDRELIDALISDIHMIHEDYGVRFFRNAKLVIWASDEWGDPRSFTRHNGEQMNRLDSTHYRPACLDYDL